MLCTGFEPGVTGWWEQTILLSHVSRSNILFSNYLRPFCFNNQQYDSFVNYAEP